MREPRTLSNLSRLLDCLRSCMRRSTKSCRACPAPSAVAQVYLPYAMKLLIQELMSMSVASRLMV